MDFYLKNGFVVQPEIRLETEKLSAVKIEWRKPSVMDTDNQKEYWDRVANEKTFTHPVDTALLSEYVNRESLILDFGCGYGRVVRILLEHGYVHVVGYDTSEALVVRGRAATNLPIFHIAEPAVLPVEENSVDCILLFAVLTCIPSNEGQRKLMELLRSKLKEGGIIYISDYYLQQDVSEVGKYSCYNDDLNNYGVFSLPEGAVFRHHTREWIAELMKDFRIEAHKEIEVMTMNGHKAEAFQIIARK